MVVVAVPPTGTVEGLNDFDIGRGSPWARSGGALANPRIARNARRRSTNMLRSFVGGWRSIVWRLRGRRHTLNQPHGQGVALSWMAAIPAALGVTKELVVSVASM